MGLLTGVSNPILCPIQVSYMVDGILDLHFMTISPLISQLHVVPRTPVGMGLSQWPRLLELIGACNPMPCPITSSGQGYLINNREIIAEDVEDFEYTPKPEFEGPFEVINEPDEASLIRKFFEHIQELKPLIQVTYNGDGFDWPFLETRARIHGMSMKNEIGFEADSAGEYKSTYASHLDCFRWVKRDSYLPVGSQGLKAVTKAKLRYNPVEIHYEDICRMAAEQPQELCNYSVSDAVATYYLYMKYVHPFIFALCTIIPLGPDDVLRKGSGTLCEALLMTQSFRDNIVMPNKHKQVHTKLHEGHLLETETYVGGHVEALESGVFRNDIPCRFRVVPEAIQKLIDGLDAALRYAITEEEKFDFDKITNYEEEMAKVKVQLEALRDEPYRREVPLIYHLDVAAMYPNIILTNRLQPMAMVDEATCAACDFNRPDSNCQRKMDWTWRGDMSPASKGEFEMVKLQLQAEKFPGLYPDSPPRAFHDLNDEEQGDLFKARLKMYAQKVYKKSKNTKIEERESTVCQRENPFYIDTVRAFRDRRYVYKGLLKETQRDLPKVIEAGDPAEVKRVKNLVVLYDSLQLAHKCILNSFYGYVMRKGARWYNLEMAGIVCLTGANIITKAREIVEQIGRPLELDTDGIWCILPGTFPENIEFETTLTGKKSKLVVSYPGAMLNVMVKDHFTNDQYQTLREDGTFGYDTSVINSIFFEVDGPYKAMILPASKEKDKLLKKRYAVYDLDGSLAELKGFEIKRNGELKIIKVFQAGVFDSFLLGSTLPEIYAAVGRHADHWLDVLFTKGENLSDHELFELIGENRSMSRALAEYGTQKSTSITTAKRLAEFLGDDMVKDKGLACNFVIVRNPVGAPVTERAIPVAIFQADNAVKKSYLRKWMKSGGREQSFAIRDILDWEYYIERLSGTIQKIITIPAALQDVPNPVPRVRHPDWLHARLLTAQDTFKQKKMTEMFAAKPKPDPSDAPEPAAAMDMEDQFSSPSQRVFAKGAGGRPRTTKHAKRGRIKAPEPELPADWKEALGPDNEPKYNTAGYPDWLAYNKKKWKIQRAARARDRAMGISNMTSRSKRADLGGFFARQAMSVTRKHWEIIQITETNAPGVMRVWALVNGDLHCMKINAYRRFFVNMRVPDTTGARRRVNRALPRARPCLNLYEFVLTEKEYQDNQRQFSSYFAHPDVEGVYETQVPLLWRAIVELGCVASINPKVAAKRGSLNEEFTLPDFDFKTTAECDYLENDSFQRIYLHHNYNGNRGMFAIFFPEAKKAHIFVIDPGRNTDWDSKSDRESHFVPTKWRKTISEHYQEDSGEMKQPEDITFVESRVFETEQSAGRPIHQLLLKYTAERHGPTILIIQSPHDVSVLSGYISSLNDFPIVTEPSNSDDNAYPQLMWQSYALGRLLTQFAWAEQWLSDHLARSRYSHVPVGNLPADYQTFTCDVFLARNLKRENHLLWVSPSARPDLGGKEEDDNRMLTEVDNDQQFKINEPGTYNSVCVIELQGMAVNTILRSGNINDMEGAAGSTMSLDALGQSSLEDMMGTRGAMSMITSFDETAQCTPVFRVLKGLVHTWLHEVVKFQNEHADEQLLCLHRWLKSSEAKLYDPALYRMVQYMMKKVFMQLVAEFKRLGANIVAASMDRILIDTGKSNCGDARKYIEYILGCIKAKPLFSTLVFHEKEYWEHLVWMDSANFGGIKERDMAVVQKHRAASVDLDVEDGFTSPDEDADRAITPGMGESENPEFPLHMNWNIAEFLPDVLRERFDLFVGHWVYQQFEKRFKARKARGGTGMTPIKRKKARSEEEAEMEEMELDPVFQDVAEKLISYVPKITQNLPGDAAAHHSEEFPVRPGSHLRMNNPALEFVKYMTKVLSLDEGSKRKTVQLRSNLLKLIKIREFSEEAKFRDPCLTFTLEGVSCSFCSASTDLDLCRDTAEAGKWSCGECGNHFAEDHIEHLLLEYVHRKSLAFQLQDLDCMKCKLVKAANMPKGCGCSGVYKLKTPANDMIAVVKTMKRIADYHKFEMLEEEMDWMTMYNQVTVA